MLTQEDIQKLISVFVTKVEFEQEMEKLREDLANKDDFGKVMTKLDSVYGEVIAFRQEQAMNSVHQEETEQVVAVLKKRVDKIEVISAVTH